MAKNETFQARQRFGYVVTLYKKCVPFSDYRVNIEINQDYGNTLRNRNFDRAFSIL